MYHTGKHLVNRIFPEPGLTRNRLFLRELMTYIKKLIGEAKNANLNNFYFPPVFGRKRPFINNCQGSI